jgi:hypothetical protein
MSYLIEKRESEWVVYAHGVPVLRCAERSMALEVMQVALECLSRPGSELAPAVRTHRSPPLAPEEEVSAMPGPRSYP